LVAGFAPPFDIIACWPMTVDVTGAIRANLVPVNRVGGYQIEAEGFSLKSRYPENRMAKVLFDAGYRGRLEVYGPTTDGEQIILRYSCDIEKMATRRMTEGDRGIRFVAWTDKSLVALKRATKHHPFAKEAEKQRPDPRRPESNNCASQGKGFSRDIKPAIDDTGGVLHASPASLDSGGRV
jgi:hypothetical protein